MKFSSEEEMYGCGWLAATIFFFVGLSMGESIDGKLLIFGGIFLAGLFVIGLRISNKYSNSTNKQAQTSNIPRKFTKQDLLELAKNECGLLSSKLGRISQIPDIQIRAKEYYKIRSQVIARRNEPIGIMLEATFNTLTNVDRNLVDSIEAR